jgi:hypothetical protein
MDSSLCKTGAFTSVPTVTTLRSEEVRDNSRALCSSNDSATSLLDDLWNLRSSEESRPTARVVCTSLEVTWSWKDVNSFAESIMNGAAYHRENKNKDQSNPKKQKIWQ